MAKITDMFHQKMESIRHKIKKEDSTVASEEEEKNDQVDDQDLYGKMHSINGPQIEQATEEDSDTDVEIPDEISDEDKARMLKRKWIILGGSVAGIFVVSMMAANFFNAGSSKQEKDPPLKTTDVAAGNIAKPNDPSKGIPGKYSDIQKYSPKSSDTKAQEVKKITPKTTAPVSSSNESVYSSYPHTTSSNNSTSRSSRPSDIEVYEANQGQRAQTAPSQRQTEAERAAIKAEQKRQQAEEDAFNSAISFALAANPSARGSSNNTSTANVSTGNTVSRSMTSTYGVRDVSDAAGSYALQAGSVIQATLITGITTDMANADVVAQVRQNIYDSQTGEHLLIPQGSRLIGKSGSAGGRGNARVGVTFTRLIYPDGHDVALPSQQAIDGVGYAGLKDQYTEHTGKLYSTAFVTALLSAAAQSATGNSSGSDDRSPGQEAVSGAVADVLDSMKTIIDRQGQVQPTATIRPGTQFSVFINQDLMLEEYSV